MYVSSLQNIANYVEHIFNSKKVANLYYHDFAHTCTVVEHASEIAQHYELNNEDHFVLLSAAWFHDVGQLCGSQINHEERSVDTMKDYFKHKVVAEQLIEKIAKCILATKIPPNPQTLLEQIICDADTYHFGTPEFLKTNKRIKREMELRHSIMPDDWHGYTLSVLKKHVFFTDYCKKRLNKGKLDNIHLIEQAI